MFKIALQKILNRNIKSNYFSQEITENDLQPIIKEMRITLLNSDVSLTVIKDFLNEVKNEVINNKKYCLSKVELEVELFGVIKSKLTQILSAKNMDLNIKSGTCSKILVLGMNGSGKTTSTAKLAWYLTQKQNKKVKNVSLDIYRPAAFEQLKKLSDSVNIDCYGTIDKNFEKTISHYTEMAYKDETDVLIFDTAGLIPHNSDQLEELKKIKDLVKPHEIIYVLDSMAGQDSLEIIRFFHDQLNIQSLLVTKADSNAPMGAAFSANYLLKIPIKFMGNGEKINDFSQFYPERIAGKILGEGDVVGLAEKIGENLDADDAKKSIKKLFSGKFDLMDLMNQIKEVRKFGSMKDIVKFLPNNNIDPSSLNFLEKEFQIWETLIQSMTPKEKKDPKIFKKQPNRRIRVIKGSGRKPDELNKLIKKWEDSKKKIEEISKKFGKKGGSLFNL